MIKGFVMSILITALAGLNLATSNVTATGNEFHVITDQERKTFNINDIQLKNAVHTYFGQAPTDVFVKSSDNWPNKSWADLFSRYKWQQTQTNMQVQDITITGISSTPVIIASRLFKNNASTPATFSANISENVANTIESNWSSSQSITTGLSVSTKLEVDVQVAKVTSEIESSFSASQTWGEGGSSSQSTTVGSSSGVSITLNPNEGATAQLIATRGVMKIRVNYIVYLSGNAAINYEKPFKGHHFWAFPISDVMQAASIPSTKIVTQDIEVGYYSDASIIVSDSHGVPKSIIAVPASAGVN